MKSVYKLDKSEGFKSVSSMKIERMAFGCCFCKGYIYCFGGMTKENERTNLCERYPIAKEIEINYIILYHLIKLKKIFV